MDELLFVDLETTDIGDDARIVQLAVSSREMGDPTRLVQLFRPPTPISFEAMAVHHITNEMVRDAEPFQGSALQAALRHRLDGEDRHVLVAHNAKFDVAVLEREGVRVARHVCTMRVAMYLWPDHPSHALQYLRYREGLEVCLGDLRPHDALADVLVLEALFQHEARELGKVENLDEPKVLIRMIEITEAPLILRRLRFGKHKGKTFEAVRQEDPSYLRWLAQESGMDEDVRRTAVHWLKRK